MLTLESQCMRVLRWGVLMLRTMHNGWRIKQCVTNFVQSMLQTISSCFSISGCGQFNNNLHITVI